MTTNDILIAFGIESVSKSNRSSLEVKLIHHSEDNNLFLNYDEKVTLSTLGIHQFDETSMYELNLYKETQTYAKNHCRFMQKPSKTASVVNLSEKQGLFKRFSEGNF